MEKPIVLSLSLGEESGMNISAVARSPGVNEDS